MEAGSSVRPTPVSGFATRNGARRRPKELRRSQLIEATIESLARRGYAATTLADVADGAGLSRGIVNFHFASKDNLLMETLRFLADEYTANWKAALARAGADTASQLLALVGADLDTKVSSPRKIAAWFALMAEAGSRPAFRKMSWERDEPYRAALGQLCARAKAEAGYAFDPALAAMSIYAMQEGLWLRMMISGRKYGRGKATSVALATLGAQFPRHFSPQGEPRPIGLTQGR